MSGKAIDDGAGAAAGMPRIKVVYLGGHARSGSTVFEMLLGQLVESSFCAGELTHLPSHIAGGVPCSLGHPLPDCPVWEDIFNRFSTDWWAMLAERRSKVENRIFDVGSPTSEDREYASHLAEIVLAVADSTGSSTIIDSSKTQLRGRRRHTLLSLDDRIDTNFIHLERPFRASVQSAYSSKGAPTAPNRNPVLRASLTPLTRALSQREAKRQTKATGGSTIKFNKFRKADPKQVGILADALGVSDDAVLEAISMSLEPQCSIGGNRIRQSGAEIRIGERAKQ